MNILGTMTHDTELPEGYFDARYNDLIEWRELTEEKASETVDEYLDEICESNCSDQEKIANWREYLEDYYAGIVEEEVDGLVEQAGLEGYEVTENDRAHLTEDAQRYWIREITSKITAFRETLED